LANLMGVGDGQLGRRSSTGRCAAGSGIPGARTGALGRPRNGNPVTGKRRRKAPPGPYTRRVTQSIGVGRTVRSLMKSHASGAHSFPCQLSSSRCSAASAFWQSAARALPSRRRETGSTGPIRATIEWSGASGGCAPRRASRNTVTVTTGRFTYTFVDQLAQAALRPVCPLPRLSPCRARTRSGQTPSLLGADQDRTIL
jgi:hypothetical protein